MKQLSLSTKIFLLALANLALLALAFLVLAQVYFHVELPSLLFAPAQDRVVDVARQVSLDLEHTSTEEQTGLMGRYAAVYGVDFYLFQNSGEQLAGRPVSLPDEVAAELTRGGADDGKDGKGPPPRRRDGKRPPPPRRDFDQGLFPVPDDRPGPPPGRGRGEEPTIWNLNRTPVFEVSAGDLHWAGVRMPIPDPEGGRPLRGTLLIAAKSFYGTPLFFDFKPWLYAMLAAMAIFTLCWLPFIRNLTGTISKLTKATERIAEGDFELHLKEDRGDELGKLAVAINRMTGRLAGFVTGQKRFLGDIAHELCAPIARIQFGLGILEQRVDEPQMAAVTDVQDEVRQMTELVGELLSFSKAGMEAARRPITDVNVQDAVRRAVEREASSPAVIQTDCEDDLFAQADSAMLIRAISNIVRNAIRYAGDSGVITVVARRVDKEVSVLVRDCGPGLDPADLDRVFAPFYRPEASRVRSSGGVGLGLAIVKSCVEACQGTVQCRNRTEGGLEVEIRLKAPFGKVSSVHA